MMTLIPPTTHDLAERLLAAERDNGEGQDGSAAGNVCGRLGALLSKLAGAAGYHSLLSRAVALAKAEVPTLATLHVMPDGTLIGFYEARARTEKDEFASSEVMLVAQLLGLLMTFIGEPLTLQLVKEAWPAITIDPSSDSPTP